MLITRETDYALRIVLALSSNRYMTVSEVCKQELVPQQFAYKILKKLEQGKIVEIIRGNKGGCRLCCDLNQITLYDLLQIVGDHAEISACMEFGYECSRRKKKKYCSIHQELWEIQNTLNEELKRHTIGEIAEN